MLLCGEVAGYGYGKGGGSKNEDLREHIIYNDNDDNTSNDIHVMMSPYVCHSEQFRMYLNLDMAAPQTFARTFTKPGSRLY